MENGQKEIGEEVTTHITGERRQRKIMGDGNIFETQEEHIFPFSQTRDNSEYLKVASVFVKWVVAEVHQAGDLDGDLDVEGDPLRSRDSQPSHLIENVVFLEFLQGRGTSSWSATFATSLTASFTAGNLRISSSASQNDSQH